MSDSKTETLAFDIADFLGDRQSIAGYLKACLEDGGIELFQKALGDVARARGMSEVADASGVTRASLYKSLSESGSPALSTIDKVIATLGLRLSVEPISEQVPGTTVVKAARKQTVTAGNRFHLGEVQMASSSKKPVVTAVNRPKSRSRVEGFNQADSSAGRAKVQTASTSSSRLATKPFKPSAK